MQVLHNRFKPWVVCLTSALFFLYEFIQINMFSSIDPDVIKAFHLNATELGWLSACYFYTTVGFLLPAGQILDYFSPKKVILITLFICIVGIIGFSQSTTIPTAVFFRLLEGIGSAFCFLGSFRIATQWFPSNRIAMITGIVVTIGMLGGVVAQTPLALLVEAIGWRTSLLIDAALGLLILLLIVVLVDDSPDKKKQNLDISRYWQNIQLVYLSKHNWLCGLYTCLLNLPLVLLGALWGSMYLEHGYHFSHIQASNIITMIFLGTIVGSPLAGYISDYFFERKWVMFIGGLLSVLTALLIIYPLSASVSYFVILFFLIGLFSGTQVLGYPAAAERNISSAPGMSASVVSFTTMSGYIIFQPLFGWLMDLSQKSLTITDETIYSLASYHQALILLPITLSIAMLISLYFQKHTKI